MSFPTPCSVSPRTRRLSTRQSSTSWPTSARAPRTPRSARKSAAAARSLGARRAPATLVRGSIRAPQWTHGGVALGPKPRSYYFTINKKVKRLALLSALSDKAANGNLIVVDKIAADEYKTKTVVAFLAAVGAGKKNLIVNDTLDTKFVKSAANIPGVKTAATGVNTYDVVNADKLILSLDAAKKLEGGICVMKFAQDIVLAPVITENSMAGIADKKYTFKVATDATKIDIANAVEELFGVKVAKVNTITVRGRYRRQGMHAGYTAKSKKAIVTLTADSKEIEFFNSMV